VPILQYTQSFKWPQQILGSKYRILIKPTGNYGGRIQPALGTEFVYPIYFMLFSFVLESDVPILQYTQSFKWSQQIQGSKYQILTKPTGNYGGRIQPALGTEFVYPIYYLLLFSYSGIGCTIFTIWSVLW